MTYSYTHAHVYVHTHVNIHTYIHAHTHTCTHACFHPSIHQCILLIHIPKLLSIFRNGNLSTGQSSNYENAVCFHVIHIDPDPCIQYIYSTCKCRKSRQCAEMENTATNCNTLQQTATHCSRLQYTATR